MNDVQLLERLAWADEYPPATPLPEDIRTVDAISREVERRTGMTQTTDHKAPETGRPPGRTRLILAAAAAFVVVILLGAAIWATTARQTGGEVIDAPPTTGAVPTTQAAPANPEAVAADIAFVERFVDTWFESSGSLLAMTMIDETADGPEDDQAHVAEVGYQAAIEADVSVTDCEPDDGQRVYFCIMSYSNMLFEAVDAPPFVSQVRFEVISDGRIAPIPDDLYPASNNGITLEWFLFEEEMGLAAESPCKPYGSDAVACPALQREHLDEFVAWRAGSGSPEAEAADIGFIERFVDTWFESMDPMTAMTMIDVTAYPNLDDRTEDDQAHVNEITYQAAIEADVSVSDCVPTEGQRVFACTVSYSNMLFEAVDAPPSVTAMEFKVLSDARIAPMAVDTYPGNNEITAAWLRFEEEAGLGGQGSCKAYGSDSVACPNLQREHLDEFTAWWTESRG